MTSVYLVLTFCALTTPSDCRHVYPDDVFKSAKECADWAQAEAAIWVADHGGYEFSGATCTISKPVPEEPT